MIGQLCNKKVNAAQQYIKRIFKNRPYQSHWFMMKCVFNIREKHDTASLQVYKLLRSGILLLYYAVVLLVISLQYFHEFY